MSQEAIANPKKLEKSAQNEFKPTVGLTYWVRCSGSRTRAIYTSTGKWLTPHNGKEVDGVIGFFE